MDGLERSQYEERGQGTRASWFSARKQGRSRVLFAHQLGAPRFGSGEEKTNAGGMGVVRWLLLCVLRFSLLRLLVESRHGSSSRQLMPRSQSMKVDAITVAFYSQVRLAPSQDQNCSTTIASRPLRIYGRVRLKLTRLRLCSSQVGDAPSLKSLSIDSGGHSSFPVSMRIRMHDF